MDKEDIQYNIIIINNNNNIKKLIISYILYIYYNL